MAKRVLLIEDEPNIIEALRFILSRDDWLVETHSDGATAMANIDSKHPDVVVLDVMLPNRSGFDILKDIRTHQDFSDLPVLMLTARGQDNDRDLANSIGATAFMTKPFSNSDLVQVVNELANK